MAVQVREAAPDTVALALQQCLAPAAPDPAADASATVQIIATRTGAAKTGHADAGQVSPAADMAAGETIDLTLDSMPDGNKRQSVC